MLAAKVFMSAVLEASFAALFVNTTSAMSVVDVTVNAVSPISLT